VGGMSSDPNSGWIEWFKILGGGSIGGFIGSLIFDPLKKKLQSPPISVLFPINSRTNIQASDTAPYVVLNIVSPTEDYIVVRCIVENQSQFFTVEQCRVFLTGIKTRNSSDMDWKLTEYRESNQVAWSENQFQFEAVDIFPWTAKAFEPLRLCCGNPYTQISVNIPCHHYAFQHIFPNPLPNEKGWKFSFLVVGRNIHPTSFDFNLESSLITSQRGSSQIFHINGCSLNRDQLVSRN
jgi:hypothetical protein